MSRTEAHEMLDKVLNSGYCGEFIFHCFKGGVSQAESGRQIFKTADELMLIAL